MKVELVAFLALACLTNNAIAFAPTWSHFFRVSHGHGIGNMNSPPPPPPSNPNSWSYQENEGGDWNKNNICAASILGLFDDQDKGTVEQEQTHQDSMDIEDCINGISVIDDLSALNDARGGSTKTESTNDVVAGAKSSLQTTIAYWSDVFQSLQKKASNVFKKDRQKDDEVDLTKIPVQAVKVNSEILPDTIVELAALRSGMLGSGLSSDRVSECARQLKKVYLQRGYVLHTVTGATLNADSGVATLNVQEPTVHALPLDIKFAKEVPIDPETGEATTRKKYRDKLERSKGRPLRKEEWTAIAGGLNTTLIESRGRTNPRTLSKRMGLKPGSHFQWNGDRWQSISRSGIFSKVWNASPVQMEDGTVQLQVLAQESPPRNLEYGLSKSLYTGHWEGELDFRHENILGGGESLGLIVRRGAKDPEPSVTLRFSDDKFGMNGGYDTEFFKEYIAIDDEGKSAASKASPAEADAVEIDATNSELPPLVTSPIIEEEDTLLCREGFKFSLRGPISSNIIRRSSASALLERTSTRKGVYESIGSATLSAGPFVQDLPLGARTSLATSVTSGARVGGKRLLPYSSASVTTRQIFPLFTERIATTSEQAKLALQHTLMGATSHFPRHEANAAGLSARVRGYSGSANGPINSSIVGSAEIRIPITIPIRKEKLVQDGSIVFFGDWMFATRQISGKYGFSSDDVFGNSSIGIGVRKSVQGIPLKYDISLSRDGRVGAFASLGGDWDIY